MYSRQERLKGQKMRYLIFLLFLLGCDSDYYAEFERHGDVHVILNGTATVLKWEADIFGVDDIIMMHIHCQPSGAIGVTLRPSLMKGESYEYAKGRGMTSETDWDNKCGWKTLLAVQDAIKNDTAYINVHTKKFPAGEVQAPLLRLNALKSFWERWDDIRH